MKVFDYSLNEDVIFEGRLAKFTYLVMPLYPSGTLFEAVKKYAENKGFEEGFAKNVFK